MRAIPVIAAYGLREALRRRVFPVVLVLTLVFLSLYWLGTQYLFDHLGEVLPPEGVDARTRGSIVCSSESRFQKPPGR